MPLSADERTIIEDNNFANRATANYMQGINDELFARAGHLTVAVAQFSAFLNLQELPKKFDLILSIAGTFLPVVCPELFLAKFLGQTEEAVKRALAVASALGDRKAKAVNAITKGKEVASKIVESNERRAGRAEKLAKLEEVPGAQKIAQLDAAESVVNMLIFVSRKAYELWQTGTLAVATEFKNRLDDPKRATTESLENMAKRLLPPPPNWTANELKQLEKVYLYQMIKSWVSSNVTVEDDIEDWTSDGGGMRHDVKRRGLNNNQEQTLMSWFGIQAPRGTVFTQPPIIDLDATLLTWGAPLKEHTTQRFYRGNRI